MPSLEMFVMPNKESLLRKGRENEANFRLQCPSEAGMRKMLMHVKELGDHKSH